METISYVKQVASRVGHLQNGRNKLRAKLHFLFFIINAINLILSLMVDSEKNTVILIIKELNNIIFTITIHSGFSGIYTLCNRIEIQLKRKFSERILPDIRISKQNLIQDMNSILVNSRKILIFVFIMYNFFPLFQTIYILSTRGIRDDNKINIQKLPFVFYFYYFNYNSSLTLYFTVTVVQIICSGTTIVLLFCIFNAGFIAVKSLVFEIEMTGKCMSVINERIDDYVKMRRNGLEFENGLKFENDLNKFEDVSLKRESALKRSLKYLIKQHQSICNDLKIVDKGLQNFVLACNNSFGIQICMSIYCTREMDGFFMKLEYSLLLIWIVWIMEMYSALGQQVTDQGENLRLSLSNCNWLESPQWCQRSLLIMMTKATKTMEIKPYGLSALNLRSFTHVINAAYSYFNLLQNLK